MNGLAPICTCGRVFAQHNALSNHQRSCRKSKTRLSGALGKFKTLFEGRKRQRLNPREIVHSNAASAQVLDTLQPGLSRLRTVTNPRTFPGLNLMDFFLILAFPGER